MMGRMEMSNDAVALWCPEAIALCESLQGGGSHAAEKPGKGQGPLIPQPGRDRRQLWPGGAVRSFLLVFQYSVAFE